MTNEQIEQAAESCAIQEFPAYKDENCPLRTEKIEKFSRLFKAGCDYALSHQWTDVKDELPEKDDIYFVLVNSKVPLLTTFNHNKGIFEPYRPYNITHWMPIPKLVEE